MRLHAPRTTALVLLLAALASGCRQGTAPAAARLLDDVSTAMGGAARSGDEGIEELLRRGSSLEDLPPGQFSADDLSRRSALLSQLDTVAVDVVDTWASAWAARQFATLQRLADPTARAAVLGDVNAAFLADVRAVTRDAAKGQACNALLGLVTGPDEPTTPGDEAGWQNSIVEAAKARLAIRWTPATVANLVAWSQWQQGVSKDSAALLEEVSEHPQPTLELLTRPPVQRAAVAYAKFCHGLPR